MRLAKFDEQNDFYPRPPRGGRLKGHAVGAVRRAFLSTPSARRATSSKTDLSLSGIDFYPRPPRGGRQYSHTTQNTQQNFYPRPPRGGRRSHQGSCFTAQIYFYPRPPRGGRPARRRSSTDWRLFLSTPSARRATRPLEFGKVDNEISIHALREEGDLDCDGR